MSDDGSVGCVVASLAGGGTGEPERDEGVVRSTLSMSADRALRRRGDVRRGSAILRCDRAGRAVQLVLGFETGDE